MEWYELSSPVANELNALGEAWVPCDPGLNPKPRKERSQDSLIEKPTVIELPRSNERILTTDEGSIVEQAKIRLGWGQ